MTRAQKQLHDEVKYLSDDTLRWLASHIKEVLQQREGFARECRRVDKLNRL